MIRIWIVYNKIIKIVMFNKIIFHRIYNYSSLAIIICKIYKITLIKSIKILKIYKIFLNKIYKLIKTSR